MLSPLPPDTPPPVTGPVRVFFGALAGGFFLLGMIGAVLPGLPTTPFLLLTSYFLLRSSPELNDRLLRTRWFGPLLRDWQQRGGVRPGVKVRAIVFVTIVVGLTIRFSGLTWPWVVVVACAALVGVLVVWRLPEARPSNETDEMSS